jgi:hypothetical protein
MPRGARRDRLEGANPNGPLAHARRKPRAQQPEPLAQDGVALVAPERLEPPRPVGVEAQQVVVEGEREAREGHRPRRPGWHRFEGGAEPVAEEAEPAAADRRVGLRLRLHLRLLREQRERVGVGRRDHDRFRADDRPAARPVAGQRKGPLVVPDH